MVSYHCYRSHGWHSALSLIAGLLEIDCPDFGSDIEEIKIDAYFRSDKKPQTTHEDEAIKHFEERLSHLPRYTFFRQKKRFQIRYESSLAGSQPTESGCMSPDFLVLFFQEIRTQLEKLVPKVDGADFDRAGFLKWLELKAAELPADSNTLNALTEKINAYYDERDWVTIARP